MKKGFIGISIYAIPDLLLRNAEVKKKIALNTAEEIDNAVSKAFGVHELSKRTRKREIVEARQTAMYFYNMRTKLSLSQIGYMLGKFDHATVLHAKKTVNNLIDTNKDFAEKVEEVKKYLAQY